MHGLASFWLGFGASWLEIRRMATRLSCLQWGCGLLPGVIGVLS